jgi:cation diffusion facilitator CzcD-associated flavoprotein CzcO
VDFSDQRVGIIGTGSSGIQSIPLIAAQAERLTVFQRTPQYSLPANNHDVTSDYTSTIKKNYKTLRQLAKVSPGGFITGFGPPSASSPPPPLSLSSSFPPPPPACPQHRTTAQVGARVPPTARWVPHAYRRRSVSGNMH